MTTAIVAELKALFGDAAGFCAHADGKSAPAPHGPCIIATINARCAGCR